jgi:hypothetical protein
LLNGFKQLEQNDKFSWRAPIMELLNPNKPLLPIASIRLQLDPDLKGKWNRIDMIHDLCDTVDDHTKKLTELVEAGLKKIAKDSISKKENWPSFPDHQDNQERFLSKLTPNTISIPYAEFGDIATADNDEIDRFLDISLLIQKYLNEPKWNKPLSMAVFGPPGSGKSFTVKEIIKSVRSGTMKDTLAYNMAQFNSIEDLIAAFHQVQDRALAEEVPLIIFDEFDAQFGQIDFGWLKYFLAPMQDGEFKSRWGTYKIGRAIFVFSGGISETFDEFNKSKDSKEYDVFKNAKGPDFISRLRSHLNIKGINSSSGMDNKLLFRRAVILRSLLERYAGKIFHGKDKKANIQKELIQALLRIPKYEHGVRSMEAIIQMAILDKGGFFAASLPRREQLNMHVDADEFLRLLR